MPPNFYEKMEDKLNELLGEDNYTIQNRGSRVEISPAFLGTLSGHKSKPFDREKVIENLIAALKELAPDCRLEIKENTF